MRRLFRALPSIAFISICLVASGCSFLNADSCADQANLPAAKIKELRCEGGFFSAKRQRETVYDGDDSSRLWTGAEPRTRTSIDTSVVNQAPAARAPVTGYMGPLRVDYVPDEKAITKDLSDIRSAGAAKFDPDERVTVKFEKVSIDFFLKQLLSGALGVNYVAPDDLGGSITFRTEQPIPKSQVLQLVRDVLGRNGLEMRFLNGVYHIATPEAMAGILRTTAAGRLSDQGTRVVRLRKGTATEIIGFVKQLVPDDVSLTASNGGDSIIVRASPADIDKVSELISMSDTRMGDDRVAIIPLRQSSPEKVALQLTEFYRAQGAGGTEAVTIVPLENQQAILAGAKDKRIMRGLRQLVIELDRDTGGDMSLRIIPLRHLGADEIVPQLTSIFSQAAQLTSQTGRGGQASQPQGAQPPGINPFASQMGNIPGPMSAPPTMAPPANPIEAVPGSSTSNSNASSSNSSDASDGAAGAQAGRAAGGSGGGGGQVRFVADTRNNTVMVYSSYSTFKRVKALIQALDVPQPQVVIEAVVAEVDLNDSLQRGVEAFLTAKGAVEASSSADGVLPAYGARQPGGWLHTTIGVDGAKVDIILHALQSITNVKVISSPYVTVLDGKTARLVVGDQIPFSTTTQSSNLNAGVTVTQQIQVEDTGIVLEVTPKIRADNSAILTINQKVSAVSPTSNTGSLTPTISTREVKSDVIAQSGSTILLGGLIKDSMNRTETGVPVARSIPYVGELFKQTSDTVTRQELIVMITPRVIRHSSQIEYITRQLRGQLHIRSP
jgi:general secretion pathway protein D